MTGSRVFWLMSGLALAGCGGGGTSSNPFVLSGGTASVAGSGLSFAEIGDLESLADLMPGDTFKIRLLRYENLQGSDSAELVTSIETVTLVDDGAGGFDARITFNGETVLFDLAVFFDDVAGAFIAGESTLANGQAIEVFTSSSGSSSATLALFAYSYLDPLPIDGFLNTEGNFVIGFETSPSSISARSGSASYQGSFGGFGPVLGSDGKILDNEAEDLGTIDLEVLFQPQTISAQLTGLFNDDVEFSGTLEAVPLSGNSFNGAFSVSCPELPDCASSSELGGSFFGPNGEEVSGLISFDISATNADTLELIRYVSISGFTAIEE